MRGIYTPVTDIRRKVFTEVARMAYAVNELSDDEKLMRELPFKIIPGEEKSLRSSIFLERAIISERVRLAMGMSLRPLDESVPASEGLEHSVIADKYYEPPLINVIKFACNACPEKIIKVTAMCQGCLAHPCQEVCPKHAISFRNGKSHIDQSLCVKCGRCVNSCPYSAIVKTERPCAAACGMGAIHSDEHGRAEIDYDKCVSCGMCLVNCPFGAIVDKGQIFQLIQSIKRGDEVVAIVAPAFINQFPGMTPSKLKEAMRQLGFAVERQQCSDDPEVITGKMQELLTRCDAVITSGGVSVGQKDYLPLVLEKLGAQLLVEGVAQKPGSPMLAATLNGKLVFCLSGNPFAAAATLEQYAIPALLRAAGRREESCLPARTVCTLTNGFSKASKGNRYLRATACGGKVTLPGAGSTEVHSSGALSAMMGCNCLVEISAGSGPVEPGMEVEVLCFVQ